ncbi:MAG: flippase [Candidatus Aminicenantes bacterium]|nr:MAG: flippase [Candidatus Aminicenantes bacterium]
MKNFLITIFKQNGVSQGLGAKLFRNFSWLFVGAAGRLIIGLIAIIYLARVLEPQGFGQVSFALAVLAYFILITDCGLQTLGTREIAAGTEDEDQIVGKILTIRSVLIIASLGILLAFAPLITPSSATKNLLLIFSVALIPMGLNLAWFFRGKEQMMLVALSELLQVGFYLAFLLALVKSTKQLFIVPIIFFGGHVISAIYLAGIYTRRSGLPQFSTSAKENWRFLRIAVPIVITLFLHQIYFNFDTIMLGFFRSETEVGLYNSAYHVIMAIIVINTVFMEAIYPTFSKLHREKPNEVSDFLNKTLSLCMIFAVPIGLAGTILGKSIILILYGTEYSGSTLALQILIWSASLAFIGANYGYCLVACQQQKALAIAAGIGTATNIALNFLLIPKYGILGACLATLIAQVIMLICEFKAFALKVSPTFPSAILTLKVFAAGAIMGLVLIYLSPSLNFFVLVMIGLIVYFSILWFLGSKQLRKLLYIKN